MAKITTSEIATEMGWPEKTVTTRLLFLGYKETCGRCGGTGQYSFNQMDGTRCYGCMGAKVKLVVKRSQLNEVKTRVAAGELEPYFEANRKRNAVRKISEQVINTWKETLVGRIYNRDWRECETKNASKLFESNRMMSELYQRSVSLAERLRTDEVTLDGAYAEGEALLAGIAALDMTEDEVIAEGFAPPA